MSYGTTILLNEDNDFTFNSQTNTLSLVSDKANLLQSIRILLQTGLKEIKTFPTYGIDILQFLDKSVSNDMIKNSIYSSVIRDPRVSTIDKITLERVNRTLDIYMQLTSQEGATLDFRANVSW